LCSRCSWLFPGTENKTSLPPLADEPSGKKPAMIMPDRYREGRKENINPILQGKFRGVNPGDSISSQKVLTRKFSRSTDRAKENRTLRCSLFQTDGFSL
jgi:hypothetical protein